MILAIADDDVTGRCDGNTLQTLEFTVTATPSAKRLEERPLRAEYLYSVVARVGDHDVTLVIDSDTPWKLELTLVGALRPERGQHTTVHVEYLDTMVVPVAHDHAIRVAHRDVMRMFQLATSASAGTEFPHERAVRLKYLRKQDRCIVVQLSATRIIQDQDFVRKDYYSFYQLKNFVTAFFFFFWIIFPYARYTSLADDRPYLYMCVYIYYYYLR